MLAVEHVDEIANLANRDMTLKTKLATNAARALALLQFKIQDLCTRHALKCFNHKNKGINTWQKWTSRDAFHLKNKNKSFFNNYLNIEAAD